MKWLTLAVIGSDLLSAATLYVVIRTKSVVDDLHAVRRERDK